jgi:hypothetical protein
VNKRGSEVRYVLDATEPDRVVEAADALAEANPGNGANPFDEMLRSGLEDYDFRAAIVTARQYVLTRRRQSAGS